MKEYITDFDQLYEAANKCRKNVSWKPSVKSFILNSEENLHRMEDQLKNGAWKNGKPRPITITYPKRREGLSIPFKDRVYQRSINDNSLYPQMTRHFIYANAACQTGKGPDFARKLVKKYLWNYFCKYGNEGWFIQVDIHGYYPNMAHNEVHKCFRKGADSETCQMSMAILDEQYAGETGYNPGSQMVQIAGISLLNDLDHYIKEKLHAKYYIRYMDDLWILWHDFAALEKWFEIIKKKLEEIGFELNEQKSHISKLSDGFDFLGFRYRMTETGKVIMTLKSDSTRHERRKLKRMVMKEMKGELEPKKTNECYQAWKNHAENGNSFKMVQRTDRYLNKLRKEGKQHDNQKNNSDTKRRSGERTSPSACSKAGGSHTESGCTDPLSCWYV